MDLTDKLMRVVNGARKLRRARDPDSYARYESDRDSERERADHERQDQEDWAKRSREKEQRKHEFEERYAVEHERHVEGERERTDRS